MPATPSTSSPVLTVRLTAADLEIALAEDVRRGLCSTPRSIPPRWLYDSVGSRLFERITQIPEYYPTSAEREILETYAGEIAERCGAATLIELGPGSSDKTHALVDALIDVGTLRAYVGIDVSEGALRDSLTALSESYPAIRVGGVVGDFTRDLDVVPAGASRLVALMGGTIGNLNPEERATFLSSLADRLEPGEGLLLGVDLVKDPARLLAAYDDPEGVTAAFEKNALEVLNKALGSDFDLEAWDYVVRWDDAAQEVHMALRSKRDQRVRVPALDLVLDFAEGEEIHTESSYKFLRESVVDDLATAGFVTMGWWTDACADFAVVLAQRTAVGSKTPLSPASPPVATSAPAPDIDSYRRVRATTEALAAPLSPEDQTVQTIPDVSPTKWHRAHVTWFFEQFVLMPHRPGYRLVDERYLYLWNSYYEGAGPRHPRPERGNLSRPGVGEVTAYRDTIDEAMEDLLCQDLSETVLSLIELGLHHEQQHQELLLMDIKHVLGTNPLRPAYRFTRPPSGASPGILTWTNHNGGLVEIGAQGGEGFSFDNEGPRHPTYLPPFQLADRLVTAGEWIQFMDDGGYQRPELWLSDGWAALHAPPVPQGAGFESMAPLYWWREDDTWWSYTLYGPAPVDPALPVTHVSYYEADAYARWDGARLPTEAEWEAVASTLPAPSRPAISLHPESAAGAHGMRQLYGGAWQWTTSGYLPYPGFEPAAGMVGEYNGKFMVGQHVLRGSAAITPPGHARATYRNFFPPGAKWAMTGVRLARSVI